MLNAEQARARPYLRQRDIDQDEAFNDFATLYALRLSRNLTDITNAAADSWDLARHLLPILGVEVPLRRCKVSRIASLLAEVRVPEPRRIGPAFENIDRLASVLRLNEVEKGLLEMSVVASHHGGLADALQSISPRSRANAARMLAGALDCDPLDVMRATSANAILIRLGFLNQFEPRYRLDSAIDLSSDVLMPLTEVYEPPHTILDSFVRMSSASPLKPESFPHLAVDREWVTTFLRRAVATRATGVNVLLHGPPGTGKTEFCRMLARAIGCSLAEVRFDDHEGLQDDAKGRLRGYQLAQACYERNGNAIILFDDADEVFLGADVMAVGRDKGYGKGYMNTLLECNPVPTLWTVNCPAHIDRAFLRRFDYNIEFSNPPFDVRCALFADCFAGSPLPVEVQRQLAQSESLTPGQIARAARTARIADASNDGLEAFVRRGIERSTELLGLGADSTRED